MSDSTFAVTVSGDGKTVAVAVPGLPLAAANAYTDAVAATKAGKDTLMVSVLDHGAVGDGTTLDHAAINAAIVANPGKTILLPKTATGVYLVDATANTGALAQPVGIQLNQPGTRLLLDPGVTLKAQTNASQHYSVIQVTAADCSVDGGTIMGDVGTHTGSGGEWGHCVDISVGADRARVHRVRVTKAWGDGIYVAGAPVDISITDVIADDNRRQGLSLTDAVRPRVYGGVYMNTGQTAFTGPGAGIDIEPSTGQAVVDAEIVGVLLYNNKGAGLLSSSHGNALSASIVGCRAIANGQTGTNNGFLISGNPNKTSLKGCEASENAQDGFFIYNDAAGAGQNGANGLQPGGGAGGGGASLNGNASGGGGRGGDGIAVVTSYLE